MKTGIRGTLLFGAGLAASSGHLAVPTFLAALISASRPAHARAGRRYDQRDRMKAYGAEFTRYEAIMDRFYRGESIHDVRKRHNALVVEHNRMVAARNRRTKSAEEKLDRGLAPLRKLQADIDRMDEKLKVKPGASGRDAVLRHNALVERRNARVRQANELNRRLKPEVDAYNELVARVKAEVKASSGRLEAMRRDLDARAGAYEKFHESEKDVEFFRRLNRLFAGLHNEKRSQKSHRLDGAIRKVRALRRELGAWAMKDHGRRDYGLVVIAAVLGGTAPGHSEPCFFIVDTGAMRTTVAPGLVGALGIELGEETEFSLAGGKKMKGRKIVLPSVAVGKITETEVDAAAVKPSDVGIDGLLGQSFLKRFIYAIDESRKGKLILRRKKE